MPDPIRWGILGAGAIARQFARGLQALPDARLVAVASRTPARLEELSRQFAVERSYGDYSALVADPAVDIVYIATTNQLHREQSLLCLEAGKPVLCEKPFTITAAETREVIEAARRRRLFCMEAMWTRCLPLMRALPGLLETGTIGQIRILHADFGSRPPFAAENRFFNPSLGGGAMLDLGIYLLSFASFLFGAPRDVVSRASIGQTGVDEQASAILSYDGGRLATVSCSMLTPLPNEALIVGSRGQIRVHAPMYRARELSLSVYPERGARERQPPGGAAGTRPGWQRAGAALLARITKPVRPGRAGSTLYPFDGNGYHYEAAEAMRCLRAGELESPIMPLDETLEIMETMDAVRGQWRQ
jgi:predicted dehydrogenase